MLPRQPGVVASPHWRWSALPFAEVGHAFAVLSDAAKREHYDQFGEEEPGTPSGGGGRGGGHAGHAAHHGMTPEEMLFAQMFGQFGNFGPGVRQRRVYRTRDGNFVYMDSNGGGGGGGGGGGDDGGRSPEQVRIMQFMQLLPLILMLLFALTSFSSDPDTSFHLNRSAVYRIPRRTASHGVVPDIPYYVKSDFWTNIKGNKQRLRVVEMDVQAEMHRHLRRQCNRERQQQLQYKYRARRETGHRAKELHRQAQNMQMPSCSQLEEYFGATGG